MSAIVCEPLKDKVLLIDRVRELKPKKVLLIFWHGIGDLIMFLAPFKTLYNMGIHRKIREEIGWDPDNPVRFEMGLPRGLTHEQLVPSGYPYYLITAEECNDHPEDLDYDLVVKITFPMNEGQTEFTKGEWCCIHELGIDPVNGHVKELNGSNRLCGVHFNITCLPDSCNPDEAIARKIWDEIVAAGWIPIETHFEHVFHNPVNKKFDFVDSSVRRCRAETSSLVGLIRQLGAFIGVVSGNFHVALSVLDPKRILLLEKDFKLRSFTKLDISTMNIRDYQDGGVQKWLSQI